MKHLNHFLNKNILTESIINGEYSTNNNSGKLHLDKDIKLAEQVKLQIEKAGYHVEFQKIDIYPNDVLPKEVRIKVYSNKSYVGERYGSTVVFHIMNGNVYFSGAKIKSSTNTSEIVKHINPHGKMSLNSSGIAGENILSNSSNCWSKNIYKGYDGEIAHWYGDPLIKSKSYIDIANVIFDGQNKANKAEADYYTNRTPNSGIGNQY